MKLRLCSIASAGRSAGGETSSGDLCSLAVQPGWNVPGERMENEPLGWGAAGRAALDPGAESWDPRNPKAPASPRRAQGSTFGGCRVPSSPEQLLTLLHRLSFPVCYSALPQPFSSSTIGHQRQRVPPGVPGSAEAADTPGTPLGASKAPRSSGRGKKWVFSKIEVTPGVSAPPL